MNLFVFASCVLVLIFSSEQSLGFPEELYSQDPHASGVRQCRKCTLEFSKLTKEEQGVWTQYKDLAYKQIFAGFGNLSAALTLVAEFGKDPPTVFTEYNLSSGEKNLLKAYLESETDDEDEVKSEDKIQALFQTISTIKAWQEYEVQLLNPDSGKVAPTLEEVDDQEFPKLTDTIQWDRIEL